MKETLELLFAELYDAHADAVFRWMVGMLGRREDAEDAVQAVWTQLARRPERLAGADDPAAYVWASARHHVSSVLRRRALERLWMSPREEEDDPPIPDGTGISKDERRDLARAVGRLGPKLRAVVLLVGFEGCTLEETAHRLEIPRGTAASRWDAALRKLQRFFNVAS